MIEKHIPIFYEGQDDLVDILATSIVSVCYNTKSFIDFYILDCGLCDFNKRQLESMKEKFHNFSIEFIPIDLKQFEGLKGWGAGNFLDCYARLLIPELKPQLNKIIYLDSDVIALDDIQKLYDINLGKYVYGAVPDIGYDTHFQNNCVKKLGLSKKHIYPNAGVILLNTKKCRSMQFTKKIFKLAKAKKNDILVIIEDLFSMFFGNNNYKRLDNRFNMTDRDNQIVKTCAPYITKEYLDNEWNHVVIQHLSPGKVWKLIKNNYNNRILKMFHAFWFFAGMTPFYNGMQQSFLFQTNELIVSSNLNYMMYLLKNNLLSSVTLFDIITILSIKKNGNKTTYFLFKFIPLLKVKKAMNRISYKLFGFIPLFRVSSAK